MKKVFLLIIISAFTNIIYAQNDSIVIEEIETIVEEGMVERDPLLQFFTGIRLEAGFSYNMFLGPDAAQFKTSVKGFGSGFLMDIFAGRPSVDVITIGNKTYNASLGLGYSIAKYRFSKNLVFDLDAMGNTIVFEDPDPLHDYVNTFFGYGKSKLVYGSVYTPIFFNIKYEKVFITLGGFSEFYLSGKHKRKYLDDGVKVKDKIGNSAFKDYNLNKTKFGATAAISHRDSGYGLTATYFFTPFFKDGMGPNINEARIGIYYRFIDFPNK